MNGNV